MTLQLTYLTAASIRFIYSLLISHEKCDYSTKVFIYWRPISPTPPHLFCPVAHACKTRDERVFATINNPDVDASVYSAFAFNTEVGRHC